MKRLSYCFASVLMLLFVGSAVAQEFPIMDRITGKVIQKYQQATCEQLWEEKSKPKSPREQEVVEILRNNPEMRTEFINRISPTVVNKMFECGMIP